MEDGVGVPGGPAGCGVCVWTVVGGGKSVSI